MPCFTDLVLVCSSCIEVSLVMSYNRITTDLLCFLYGQLNQQEDLIVWMRTAALPTFRKLYGKINQDLKANDIIMVTLENNYNTYSFNGKKKLVLSTSSWLGGKNDFLGIAYLTIGGLCFFLATAFTVVYLVKPRYTLLLNFIRQTNLRRKMFIGQFQCCLGTLSLILTLWNLNSWVTFKIYVCAHGLPCLFILLWIHADGC